MPSYTFQERFVPFVKDGSKRQTIRSFRKYPVKPGQLISAFTGPRFEPVRIIDKQIIPKVECIAIIGNEHVYIIDTNWIPPHERQIIKEFGIGACLHRITQLTLIDREDLAWNDGFRHADNLQERDGCWELMWRWWNQTHELPFIGFITYW